MDLKHDCFCSGIVHKLYNQFEALTVRANDYVGLFNHHSVIFPRGVVHRVENGWGLTKVAAVLLNGLLW